MLLRPDITSAPKTGPIRQLHRATLRHVRRFAKGEEGTLLFFGVYVFVLILMIGGIGIDLMRFERDRSELQYTLDRAVLAAADLEQELDPESVVRDYFDKAGLGSYLGSVYVDEGFGYRKVSASAEAEVATQFMHMSGVDSLSAPAASAAEERIDSVEISLVLDVSGSMNSNSRLANLKVAARDFIDTMDANTEDGKMAISIIPYATQVSAPAAFINRFNISNEHSHSNCVNFSAADFNITGVSTTSPLERTMHFDPWRRFDGRDNDPAALIGTSGDASGTLPVCEVASAREMMIMQKDPTTLKNFITNLTARGNTSIDIGMKWGTALLDPAMRPVIQGLIADGTVDATFSNRPFEFDDPDALKVVVLMTDGRNTSQYYIHDNYRGGNSNVWWNAEEERYSVYYPGYNAWYWIDNNVSDDIDDVWADHPYGQEGDDDYAGAGCIWNGSGWECEERDWPGEAVQLSYAELWAWTSIKSVVEDLYEPWMNDDAAWDQWYYGVRKYVGSNSKDGRAEDICDAAKEEDIIVFTIGFEAPSRGRAILQKCASSDAHYFDVDGLEIAEAFASIATSIRKLRLTQ